jgi:hypothetical protein
MTRTKEKKMQHTIEQIDRIIERAEKLFSSRTYMGRKLAVLKDFRDKMPLSKDRDLSPAQVKYFNSLMATFSDEELTKAENWERDWNTDQKLRERGDIISKYYIAQRGWFMEVARTTQECLKKNTTEPPDFYSFHRMILNEYAEKVWKSHSSPHRWEDGDLVCCRANSNVNGWTYQIQAEGININKDPCMVIESDSRPISNATKYDEKRGGCRWVAINPIGTTYIFHVMEKDLKIYRQPKKKTTKRRKK